MRKLAIGIDSGNLYEFKGKDQIRILRKTTISLSPEKTGVWFTSDHTTFKGTFLTIKDYLKLCE